jgi:predicted SprT family Zn-dependent metalloprotease
MAWQAAPIWGAACTTFPGGGAMEYVRRYLAVGVLLITTGFACQADPVDGVSTGNVPVEVAAPTMPPEESVTQPVEVTPPDPETSRLLQGIEVIADSTGFAWRAAGVAIHMGYHRQLCCHWGVYDYRTNSIWIGPTAFASRARLRYVVLHELAHAWQWTSGRRFQVIADMAPWGYRGVTALEYNADCVARLWGARTAYYWQCPSDAQDIVARRLAGERVRDQH